MICAYDKMYLEKARVALGRMFDYAVYDAGYPLSTFFDMFIRSGLAHRFERGDCDILVGKSGVELAYDVMKLHNPKALLPSPRFTKNKSEEYWTGWAMAYYQWRTARTFSDIVKYSPIDEIKALYSPYHEMDIRHFVNVINEQYMSRKKDSNLKLLRLERGFTQRELAEMSGVPIRTLQQYEQRQKNINRAQAEYVIMLAKTLYCDPLELLEIEKNTEEINRMEKYAEVLMR